MMKRTRKQYPPALKAKIVLEAIRETKTVSELVMEHQLHPNLITKWRSVKYEEVYLSEYETPRDARRGLARYLSFYNEGRPHRETPPKRAFS